MSLFRNVALCGSWRDQPAMTVAGRKQTDDSITRSVIQVEVLPEHKNYLHLSTSSRSGSDSSTESHATSGSGNTASDKPVSNSSSNSSTICRICQDVDKNENLTTLCHCTGSIAKYHVSCLETWLSISKTDTCELCHEHFTTKRKPRPFSEWLRGVRRTPQSRYIYGDILCLIILTPLTLASALLCGEGSWYYFTIGQLMIATGLVTLCAFLVFLYLMWLVLSIRYHLHRWREWRKENQVVQVIVSDPKSSKAKGKHNKVKETVV